MIIKLEILILPAYRVKVLSLPGLSLRYYLTINVILIQTNIEILLSKGDLLEFLHPGKASHLPVFR